MSDIATTQKAIDVRSEIAACFDAIANLLEKAGEGPDALTPTDLGFDDTTVEEIRAEVATYRTTGRLP